MVAGSRLGSDARRLLQWLALSASRRRRAGRRKRDEHSIHCGIPAMSSQQQTGRFHSQP